VLVVTNCLMMALLDFRIPKMYGHELYDEMKKIDSKVKVCFMTAT
jgi:FixJ family two-component response regulator